jgi:hypothetical protein
MVTPCATKKLANTRILDASCVTGVPNCFPLTNPILQAKSPAIPDELLPLLILKASVRSFASHYKQEFQL